MNDRNWLGLTDENWSYGSYPRKAYKYQNLYTRFSYKDFTSFWNLNTGRYTVTDYRVENLEQSDLICDAQRAEYEEQIMKLTERIAEYDDGPMEGIYGQVQRIRRICLGTDALEKLQVRQMRAEESSGSSSFAEEFYKNGLGVDQRSQKEARLQSGKAVIFGLTQAEYFGLMKQDLDQALRLGKRVYILSGEEAGSDIPRKQVWEQILEKQLLNQIRFLTVSDENLGLNVSGIWTEDEKVCDSLQSWIHEQEVCVILYGEDGLLHGKNLLTDAIVYANATGFYTKAVTNQLSDSHPCVVYIPAHFNVTEHVRLLEKTTLSYWHLAQLQKRFGDEIYGCSVETLYRKYPQYFLNIYKTGERCPEAESDYPIRISPDLSEKNPGESTSISHGDTRWLGDFYRCRDQAIRDYLKQIDGMDYVSSWFSERMEEQEIPWGKEEPSQGILVHGIRVKQARDSEVLSCPDGTGMHQMTEQIGSPGIQIFSNFLFFMTPRLSQMYQELRKERPLEHHEFHREHLDFQMIDREGKRVETFPLFKKSCIGMKKDGHFLFFNFRLGGGRIRVGNQWIRWSKEEVDVRKTNSHICLYTPFYSAEDEAQNPVDYQKLVGYDRLNLVVIQDKLICIRMGEVMLSSAGVVISLAKQEGLDFVRQAGLKPLRDGYFACDHLELELKLDAPDGVSGRDWETLSWAYGGGLSLILNGKSICDDGEPETHFREEGWMSPLSRQTQEAEIHRMVKHPRTAIGLTGDGSLVILVYSGRIPISSGADYREMAAIARTLFPNIRDLMNVDGGGSAMLGMAIDGNFMELSYPALSLDSCAGMVRPIHTVLCIRP